MKEVFSICMTPESALFKWDNCNELQYSSLLTLVHTDLLITWQLQVHLSAQFAIREAEYQHLHAHTFTYMLQCQMQARVY